VLHSFCLQRQCKDGQRPAGNLIIDSSGSNLYGTTLTGAPETGGTAFKLSLVGSKKYQVLHQFDAHSEGGDVDYLTYIPQPGQLYYDGTSPLYAVAAEGGTAAQGGALMKLTLKPKTGKWDSTVLYQFCPASGCLDGQSPNPGLVFDSGNIYGTTKNGGANNSSGTVFEVTPGASQPETVLYNFCMRQSCPDGANPVSGPVKDASGNLWGVTPQMPQTDGGGVLYELVPPSAQSTTWQSPFPTPHTFCLVQPPNCTDGGDAHAAPAYGPSGTTLSGTLFGTTGAGGSINAHGGTVYEYGGGQYNVLHSFDFCSNATSCPDGTTPSPSAPLAMAVSGKYLNIFGATVSGGKYNHGIVYAVAYEIPRKAP